MDDPPPGIFPFTRIAILTRAVTARDPGWLGFDSDLGTADWSLVLFTGPTGAPPRVFMRHHDGRLASRLSK